MAGKDANPGQATAATLRRAKALQLRIAGASYRKIAAQLGVSHVQVQKDIARELAPIIAQNCETAHQLAALEVARLDLALLAIAGLVQRGDLAAIDRWLRIAERRARLLGLDAPVRHDMTSNGETIKVYGPGMEDV